MENKLLQIGPWWTIRPTKEADDRLIDWSGPGGQERDRKVREAMDRAFEKCLDVYKRLADGVPPPRCIHFEEVTPVIGSDGK